MDFNSWENLRQSSLLTFTPCRENMCGNWASIYVNLMVFLSKLIIFSNKSTQTRPALTPFHSFKLEVINTIIQVCSLYQNSLIDLNSSPRWPHFPISYKRTCIVFVITDSKVSVVIWRKYPFALRRTEGLWVQVAGKLCLRFLLSERVGLWVVDPL